jgi:DNA-binding MarR family transcriptional regulator
MDFRNKLFDIHEFYNLSRYLFLNIQLSYNDFVEKTGITLPQLRVLWIIKIFKGISLGEIAKIGCWSPPTVTKMLKLLMEKNLVIREETINKKLYTLNLTIDGHNIIKVNQITRSDKLALIELIAIVNKDDLDFIIDIVKSISVHSIDLTIFQDIEKVNEAGLEIDVNDFNCNETILLKKLVYLYNLLRLVILTIVNNHRNLLSSFKLTYPQLRALWIIDAFPGITSVKLSKLAYLAPSTVNIIVKNLYEKKLIYKEKSQLKNSLFLYISDIGEELLVKEFDINQKSLLIYKDIEFLSVKELSQLNQFMLKLNLALKNDFVEEYIEKTFAVIEKRLL